RITKAIVDAVKTKDGAPFIIPAMGSHGGATAEGQREILESYGIAEETMGCPVRSSMEVVELDGGGLELSVFMDKQAFEADGVILVNRIKPHTAFHGQFESGLIKMSVIGLGKERQASALHSFGIYGLKTLMPQVGRRILETGKVLLGVGIVENAYDETAIIEAMTPAEILWREPELLDIAKDMMPRFPLGDIDVLMVDQIGKNISGSGMDPNVIGRMRIRGEAEPEFPAIKVIAATDLTEASHGNACGIGLADVVTRRLVNKVDWDATYMNGVTSGFYEHFMLPIVAATDAQALEWGIRASHDPHKPKKIVRIKDTLHLGELYVSDAALELVNGKAEIIGERGNPFDEQGSLLAF
ncbi:MAG TPA: DUF2088 domain-containing protein, partial [Blastocatellia bacterium]|nr:DUF2088 domain-containing protein [Blastocatellia bacterium]